MGLKLLVNSAAQNMARVTVTDTSNASAGDETAIENVIGGTSRHLTWQSGATSDRRIVYVNKSGGLACDYVVVTNADGFNGHGVTLRQFSAYSATSTTGFTATNFAETLYGPTSRDWYQAFSATNAQALALDLLAGTGGNYTKNVFAVFFSSAYTLSYPNVLVRTMLPAPSSNEFSYRRRMFRVQERLDLTAQKLSRTDVQSFIRLWKLREEPMFILDEDGVRIEERLLHVILADYSIKPTPGADNDHTLTASFFVLRYWR